MIKIENLDFSYKKNHPILQGLNLELNKGRIYGLLGKNGVGKTTLMHLIAGLQAADNGSITIGEHDSSKRKVAMLQDIFFLNEDMPDTDFSIEDFKRIYSKLYPKFSNEDFQSYLTKFEVESNKQKIKKLSLGTRKKVHICFGLACNTDLILLDEPTNGLDIPSKACFRKVVQSAMNEDKLMLISTHQARDLQNILDDIVILDDTNLLLNASVEEISSKLWFGLQDRVTAQEKILYQEDNIGGVATVRLNAGGEESNLDVEMLFNAAFMNKQLMKELFNQNTIESHV